MKNLEGDLKVKQREVVKIERRKEKAEETLKEKRKDQGKLGRDLAKIEQEIRDVVRDFPFYRHFKVEFHLQFYLTCFNSKLTRYKINIFVGCGNI